MEKGNSIEKRYLCNVVLNIQQRI